MAYLDENGLEHFWGKIKDHVSSAVAPKADDADVLHKNGTEAVSGEKVFSGSQVTPSGNASALLVVKDPNLVKGETPETNHYLSLGFIDSTGNSYVQDTASRLAVVEYKSPSEVDPESYMQMIDRGFNGGGSAVLQVGHDKDNIQYATAPATSDDRTNSTDIVTRGYMESSEWNWQKTKKAGTVAFKPVPESDLEPVVDFMFTETLPAEGEKGPENPSTISGVTQAKVTRCGKNLLCVSFNSGTRNGLTYTRNADGSVTISGTATQDTYYNFGGAPNISESLNLEGTYTLSGAPNNLGSNYRLVCFKNGLPSSEDTGTGISFSLPSKTHIWFSFFVKEGFPGSGNTVTFRPQLELGTAATPFEPYSGSDYTIQLGDTYYGGSLDVATGVMTVTWVGVILTATGISLYGTVGVDSRLVYNLTAEGLPQAVGGSDNCVCSHSNNYNGNNVGVFGDYYVQKLGSSSYFAMQDKNNVIGTTEQAYKDWVTEQYDAGHPVTFSYKIETPFTVQLTPTQIRSLPALDKYEPRINTVYTDQEAVQVGYQRFYDENRLASIEARLDALEGN